MHNNIHSFGRVGRNPRAVNVGVGVEVGSGVSVGAIAWGVGGEVSGVGLCWSSSVSASASVSVSVSVSGGAVS
jgi:hypothetical protein